MSFPVGATSFPLQTQGLCRSTAVRQSHGREMPPGQTLGTGPLCHLAATLCTFSCRVWLRQRLSRPAPT